MLNSFRDLFKLFETGKAPSAKLPEYRPAAVQQTQNVGAPREPIYHRLPINRPPAAPTPASSTDGTAASAGLVSKQRARLRIGGR